MDAAFHHGWKKNPSTVTMWILPAVGHGWRRACGGGSEGCGGVVTDLHFYDERQAQGLELYAKSQLERPARDYEDIHRGLCS